MNILLSGEDNKTKSVDFYKAVELRSKVDGKFGDLVDVGFCFLMFCWWERSLVQTTPVRRARPEG